MTSAQTKLREPKGRFYGYVCQQNIVRVSPWYCAVGIVRLQFHPQSIICINIELFYRNIAQNFCLYNEAVLVFTHFLM